MASKPPVDRWYVIGVEEYIKPSFERRVAAHTKADGEAYL